MERRTLILAIGIGLVVAPRRLCRRSRRRRFPGSAILSPSPRPRVCTSGRLAGGVCANSATSRGTTSCSNRDGQTVIMSAYRRSQRIWCASRRMSLSRQPLPASRAAKAATSSIPIVIVAVGEPVKTGASHESRSAWRERDGSQPAHNGPEWQTLGVARDSRTQFFPRGRPDESRQSCSCGVP